MLALLTLAATAWAETATTLAKGAATLYGGVGATTFATGASELARDRQLRPRLDAYAGFGLAERLTLTVDAPLVHATVRDVAERGPCPRSDAYCAPTTSVGESGVHLRWAAHQGTVACTVAAGVRTDVWNRSTRGRWTNVGLGTSSAVLSAFVGLERATTALVAHGHVQLIPGREVDGPVAQRLPPDLVRGALEARQKVHGVWLEASLSGTARTGGVPFEAWVAPYFGTEDRWAALAYRELAARAKVSFPLGSTSGLHLSVGRVLLADNGPRNATDVAVGVHRYVPPGRRRGAP